MLEIQTFGTVGLRNRDDTGSQVHIVQTKRLALLIYLALAPRRRCRRRDQVVALFWPELDQEHARGALSQALRYLRKTVGNEAIITQGEDEVGLDRTVIGCDAVTFLTLCEAGELELALGVYQGPFLEGFFVADAGPEYERWVMEKRAALRQRAALAAATLAERAEGVSDLPAALRWARREVALLPGEEVPTARLIRLLDQSGDRAGALRVYEELRQRLRDEFQVAPSHETQALIARILAR